MEPNEKECLNPILRQLLEQSPEEKAEHNL